MKSSHAIITLDTAALDTPNKVAVLVTDAPAINAQQQSALFENLSSLPFCSTFIRNVTKHSLQYIATGTTQTKE
jgi:hypothetical protein